MSKQIYSTVIARRPKVVVAIWFFCLSATAAFFLAGCSPAVVEAGLPVGEIMREGSAEALAQEPTLTDPPTEESATADSLTVPASGLPPIILGRAELHASDPSTVVLASGKLQLVEFIAYWCPTCKAIAPTVHGLENLYGDQINFVYLDIDDPATLPFRDQLGYFHQPHFYLLDPNGVVLWEWIGYAEGPVLQQALVDAIAQ